MSQIVNLMLDKIVEQVKADLITNIPESDAARASLVKKGLLQLDVSDPRYSITIGITGGDHETPDYKDGPVSLKDNYNIDLKIPTREVGGGEMWWRRGVARVQCFFIAQNYSEDQAFQYAYEVLGRLLESIPRTSFQGLADTHGERALFVRVSGNTFFESGGPPSDYIFRGKVFWQALTERS